MQIIRHTLSALLLAIGAAGCTDDLAEPASEVESSIPAPLAERARRHIVQMHEAGHAPTWATATLGAATPLHRADVLGPAYFDVEVLVDGAPAGHVLVSTGDHDRPVPAFATEGESPIAVLREQAGAAARFLRLSAYYAAESDDGTVVATTLPATTDPETSWRELEASVAASKTAVPETSLFSAAPRDCAVAEAPNYDQLSPGVHGNTWSYYSGCGGTAWAMMIGWIDQRAAAGDPKWAPYGGLYRQGGQSWTPDVKAPTGFEWGPRVMTNQLRQDLGSIGWPHNQNASTDVYQMGRIGYYLDRVGLDDYLNWPTHHIGGAPWPGLRNDGIAYVCDQQQPAILGIGHSSHYAVAEKYVSDGYGGQWFYLNMGWGGTRQWEWPDVFLVGSLTPRGVAPTPPLKGRGVEVLSASYGSNATYVAHNNAAAHASASCNGLDLCNYTVNIGALGDPAPGVGKDFRVTYRCGNGSTVKYASLAAEANGVAVALDCRMIMTLPR